MALLLLILICLVSFSNADDGDIMSNFFNCLSPPPSTWNTTTNYCDWEGIICDNSNRVTSIKLPSMFLNGTLPSDLNNLTQLKTLNLSNNYLSGALPSLANLSRLEKVYLYNNKFDSIPSDFFLGLTNINDLQIGNNLNLNPWILTDDLKESTKLQTFEASNTNLNGSIPDIFNSYSSLQTVKLSYNNLTGPLPATFGKSSIGYLYLQNQRLSGTLGVISSMYQLKDAELQANSFTGVIPNLINCNKLQNLQLDDNQLTGLVPQSLTSLPNLAKITLHNNMLQGPLPEFKIGVNITLAINTNRFCLPTLGPCDPQVTALLEVAEALGYPLSLAESWRGNDACVRWNFVSCDFSGKNVITVNFEKQKFSGTISPSFSKLTSLRSLSLNENNLNGSIPEILTSLPDLQLFDVSNNNLSGWIPKFGHKVKFSYKNNHLLGKRHRNFSVGMVIGIVISVLVFVGIGLFLSYKCYGIIVQNSRDHSEMPISESGNVMNSIQILKQATNNFSDNNVLGRGGFGVVYKGELPNGNKMAVKRMKSVDMKGTKGLKEFQAEIEVLTNVKHRHLVALLGYCINDNERLLVYEYMPRGTLSQHLFNWREHESQPLSWKQRVSIALDVGRGVEYLHSLAQQCFIHRDLKPANILLDDDMRAKVADFGLVKHAPDGKHSMETRLAGTFGYLAPEYAATGRVTTKVDVYAFGVVLMQLVTGLKALDGSMPDERCQLVRWFRKVPVTKETMVKFMDQDLDTFDNETLESILRVADLARQCTANQPFHRPDMGYAVNVLGPLVEQWKPSQWAQEVTYHRHHKSLPEVLQFDEDTSSHLIFVQPNSF